MPYRQTLDGFGNKITYAVTERYATPQYKSHLGSIDIVDMDGNTVLTPPGSAQFILISHGEDGKGAYSQNGAPNPYSCGPQDGRDSENCDLDGVFLSGQLASVQGPNFYDDFVFYKMFGDSLLWQVSPFSDTNIYNTTKGNVGIGTETPSAKLDVNGNIRAIGSISADRVCDERGRNCFEPEVIGGDGIQCGVNQSMVGIENSKAICEPIRISGLKNEKCPAGQFLIGFETTGKVICSAPVWPLPE